MHLELISVHKEHLTRVKSKQNNTSAKKMHSHATKTHAQNNRYYGETLPFGSDSFTNSNLQYLSVELAVADYGVFMTAIKQDYNIPDAPVVVFGGSYGGILAAACRIHYPSVFDMALAASAPIPQTLNTVNATTFFKLVTEDYNAINKDCPMIVRKGFAKLLELANSNDYSTISSTFNVCTQLKDSDDITLLILWARNGLLTMAMADYPYSADFLGSLPAWPVNASCSLMASEYNSNGKDGTAAMIALAKGAGLYYNASESDTLTCFNLTNEFSFFFELFCMYIIMNVLQFRRKINTTKQLNKRKLDSLNVLIKLDVVWVQMP